MTLRGAEPAVAFDAWLAALAARRLDGAAAGRARAARRRRAGACSAEPLSRCAANPPHRCAAMDGYAVVAAATANGVLAPGTYLRIDTGQPVEDRFDAVAQVEIARESGDGLLVERALARRHERARRGRGRAARETRCCRPAACSRATTSRSRPSPATPS